RRPPAADEDLALGVLAARHRLDLVLDQDGPPAEDRLEGLVDRAVQRVDRTRAGGLGRPILAEHGERDAAGGIAAVRGGDTPADELDRGRNLRGPLLDQRPEVLVGDLLLRVREGDRLAIDRVERLALEVVAELVELALKTLSAGQLADRQ